MDAGAGDSNDQKVDSSNQGIVHSLDEIQLDEKQNPEECYDAKADEEDVQVEVIMGDGKTHKFTLPYTATVLMLKQQVEHNAGFKSAEVRLYVQDDSREEALEKWETLGSLRQGKGLSVLITLIVYMPDAQEVVLGLAAEAKLVLGDRTEGGGDGQMNEPRGVAFVPAHPNWVVTTELRNHRIKLSNIHTGEVICKFGEYGNISCKSGEFGNGEEQFNGPWGVAVTSDSAFVIVADWANHRMKVLQLVIAADGTSVHLEFVRHIGSQGSGEGQLGEPLGMVLLPGEGGGQETVLVTDTHNHRVSQFKLDGTFIRVFAGTGTRGSGDGEFNDPQSIAVLGSSGDVVVADRSNHRVLIFDREGNYKRQSGSKGKEVDGQFSSPFAVASDAHGNLLVLDRTKRLQVFDPEGTHLCTRNDLGLGTSSKGIAWSGIGQLAVADGGRHVLVYSSTRC
jgi:DNA-binding beta-propeller fold protein YncE